MTILFLFIVCVVAFFACLFFIQNSTPVVVSFFHWRFAASLAIIISASFVIGVVISMLCSVCLRVRKSFKRSRMQKTKLEPGISQKSGSP